jgi:hypothetical protein
MTFTCAVAHATPNVEPDDPRYAELGRLEALGLIPSFEEGAGPTPESHVERLLHGFTWPRSWWGRPADSLELVLQTENIDSRGYSTVAKLRTIAGDVFLPCDRRAARACRGAGALLMLNTSAGYGRWFTAATQLSASTSESSLTGHFGVDRAYVNTELGVVELQVGRDILVIGPRARTQLLWGTNAAPLDHVRIAAIDPIPAGSLVELGGVWAVGVLRRPQTFPNGLVSIARAQGRVRRIELGLVQMIQMGGDGAPSIGVWDFIAEHFRRGNLSATEADSSDRRFGGDIAFRIPTLLGARLYYSLVFEDIRRKRFVDAVRYDADHLFGVELPAIGRGRRHSLTLEYYQTGVRSQEHAPRLTGFTNGGFAVGSPLGPDATSFYASARIAVRDDVSVSPWVELARLRSDSYDFVVDGPIDQTATGSDEGRFRLGATGRWSLSHGVHLSGEIMFEHIDDFAFEPGVGRNGSALITSIEWSPPRAAK